MSKIINLRYAATCADCGAKLQPGDRARYYGRGKAYGLDCHSAVQTSVYDEDEPLGLTYSRYDRHGIYAMDGAKLGSTCGCEDYPCCGH